MLNSFTLMYIIHTYKSIKIFINYFFHEIMAKKFEFTVNEVLHRNNDDLREKLTHAKKCHPKFSHMKNCHVIFSPYEELLP